MFGTIKIEEWWNGTLPSVFWKNSHSPQFVSVHLEVGHYAVEKGEEGSSNSCD